MNGIALKVIGTYQVCCSYYYYYYYYHYFEIASLYLAQSGLELTVVFLP